MSLLVEIDDKSGFCGGVIRAIGRAENYLEKHQQARLCSLGAIVHNEEELLRLSRKGLDTIESLEQAGGGPVLIRAHGEPPATYSKARALGIGLIDCTCPVVLRLQERIREAFKAMEGSGGKVVIFGRIGHAEVLGLVGQTGGQAVVVDSLEMLDQAVANGLIRTDAPVELFSQTTGSPETFAVICRRLAEEMKTPSLLHVHNTICSQVAFRHRQITDFARSHDVIVFVSGKLSSNGSVLYQLCKEVNPHSYRISSEQGLDPSWFNDGQSVGVCGATSTPKWLLEKIASAIGRIKTVS